MTDIETQSVMQDKDIGRPVRIVWVDSGLAVDDGWMTMEEMPNDVEEVESVGLWMGENDRIVMVGGARDVSNKSWLHCQLIWKNAIMRKEWL